MDLQNKGTGNERLFCYTEVQSAEYHYSFYLNISQCLCIFYFKFVIWEKISSTFYFLTKFPFEKCVVLPGYDAYFKSFNLTNAKSV